MHRSQKGGLARRDTLPARSGPNGPRQISPEDMPDPYSWSVSKSRGPQSDIADIAGQAHRSNQLNREMRSALHDVGIANTPAPEEDPSRGDRPWSGLLCDILTTPPSVPHVEDENAPYAFSEDLDWEMDDLISFMRADDRFHPAVCEYMSQNSGAVGAAIQAGQEGPAGWQRIAKIASTLDLSQGRQVDLTLITLAKFHLPVHAHALIEHLKQEG